MEKNFSMAETAERFGLPQSTLRYYDKEGLLPGVLRTEGGTRRFTEETLRALHIIACLKVSGLSIQQIRRYFELAAQGAETTAERQHLFEEQREAVRRQMCDLQETLDMLDYKCWYYEMAAGLGSEQAVEEIPDAEIPPRLLEVRKRISRLPPPDKTCRQAAD